MNERERLNSWKEISIYVNRQIRTCYRWAKELKLPVISRRVDLLRLLVTPLFIVGLCFFCWTNGLESKSLPSRAQEDTIKPVHELILTGHFPTEEAGKNGVYLYNAMSLSKDEKARVYVVNSRAKNIVLFDADGHFIKLFGKGGQGPGEFEFPTRLLFKKDEILVLDSPRHNIQVFNKEMEYRRTIKIFQSFTDISANPDGTIFGTSIQKYGGKYLVEALDNDGNLLFSFGEPIKNGNTPLGMLNQVKLALTDRGDILLAFQTLGQLQIYDQHGIKTKDISFSMKDVEKERSENLKAFAKSTAEKRIPFHHIIEAIRSYGKSVYLLRNAANSLDIYELNNGCEIIRKYFFKKQEDTYAFDFEVSSSPRGILFYILEGNPENRVDILTIK
jgi:hypothetical protein